jgi:hypothetical protein
MMSTKKDQIPSRGVMLARLARAQVAVERKLDTAASEHSVSR